MLDGQTLGLHLTLPKKYGLTNFQFPFYHKTAGVSVKWTLAVFSYHLFFVDQLLFPMIEVAFGNHA